MEPLILFYIAFTSISLFVCFLQLFISLRKRGDLIFLVGAVLSLMAFLYFGLLVLCSSSLGLSCSPFNLMRYYLVLTQAVLVTMLGTLYHLLQVKQKIYILFNATIFIFLILLSIFTPDEYLFGDNASIRQISLHYGGEIRMIDTGLTLWRILMDLTILVFVVSFILLMVKNVR